jgi:hypothetical protein
MKTTNNILSFENRVQVELFTCELQGQLSDGRWENSSPHDHWEPWCHAEVTYGKEVGRNFNVRRDGYCFTETSLLEVIGERMLNICNLTANGFDHEVIDQFNDVSLQSYFTHPTEAYWVKKRTAFLKAFGSDEGYKAALVGPYDMAKMMIELRSMRKIIKMHNPKVVIREESVEVPKKKPTPNLVIEPADDYAAQIEHLLGI